MSHKALLALAAMVCLGAATPALANYDYCTENPSAVGCPGNFDVTKEAFYTPPSHKAAQHETQPMAHHHG
jgi:hypothetical protein